MVEQLKAQNAAGAGLAAGQSDNVGGGMDAESARMIAELQEKLAAKQTDLSREMEGDGGGDERADQQRKVVYSILLTSRDTRFISCRGDTAIICNRRTYVH